MKLSILIPSNRPEGLQNFLKSLAECTNQKNEIEVVVLVDGSGPPDYEKRSNYEGISITTIHYNRQEGPVNMGELNNICYQSAKGEWIMLGNDDIVIETMNWDEYVWEAMEKFPDQLCLIYPNDGMFGEQLACFPIVSQKYMNLTQLFPMPYYRYKIDDTIFHMMPPNRRIFLKECMFVHLNKELNPTTHGYRLPDGKVYPVDQNAAAMDNKLWEMENPKRIQMQEVLNAAIGKTPVKVLIGVITDEYARRADFYDYYNIMIKPLNCTAFFCHARSPAKGRNIVIDTAIEQKCTHILFIDDDMAYKPDSLIRLLDHDKDIVSGLYLSRAFPHEPFVFAEADPDGACMPMYLTGDLPKLVPIVAAGFGFLLVKTSIFEKLEKPYVRLGELDSQEWCDDLGFFKRVREAGIESYCDTSVWVGHMGTMIVWPNCVNGDWFTGYDTAGRGAINVPQVKKPVGDKTPVEKMGV